jgi:hypothetical protein
MKKSEAVMSVFRDKDASKKQNETNPERRQKKKK